MPITTTLSATNYLSTAQSILIEHLTDYFPSASYTISVEAPVVDNKLTKTYIWLSSLPDKPTATERVKTTSGAAMKSGGRIRRSWLITIVATASSGGDSDALSVAATMERNAILRDRSKLQSAGILNAKISPFSRVFVTDSQVVQYRYLATLTTTIVITTS